MVRGTHAQFVGEIRGEVGAGGGILHVGQTTYQVGPGGISGQGHPLQISTEVYLKADMNCIKS